MTGTKGIAPPLVRRPGRHDIGVAGEAKHRPAAPALGPEIIHRTELQLLDGKADGLEPLDHQRLAAAVGRADRGARNQFLRQTQGVKFGGVLIRSAVPGPGAAN